MSFDKDEHEPAASAAAASLLGLAGAADPSQAADVDLSDGELRESQQLRDSDSKPEADEPLLEEALKRLTDTMDQLEEACGGDYTFIGDNIDFLVKVVGSTKAKRNKLYHWFHLIGIIPCPVIGRFACADMKKQNEPFELLFVLCVATATRNRVSPPSNLRDDIASGNMQDWTFLGTLPSVDDFAFMQRMFVVLLGRITSKRMQWMKDYNMPCDCVVDEVEHKYAAETHQKSEEVHSQYESTMRLLQAVLVSCTCSTPSACGICMK